MAKRAVAMGFAVALIFMLSVPVMAVSSGATDTVNMEFPYFGYVQLKKGNTTVFTGTVGDNFITGFNKDGLTDSNTGASALYFDLYAGGTKTKTTDQIRHDTTLTIPKYVYNVEPSDLYDPDAPYGDVATYFDFPVSGTDNRHGTISLHVSAIELQPESAGTGQGSAVTYDASDTINLVNNRISGGDYVIAGHLQYAPGSIEKVDDVLNGNVTIRIYSGPEYTIVQNPQIMLQKTTSASDDMIAFVVPFTVQYSMEFTRIQLVIGTQSTWNKPIKGFGISTGGFEYTDDVQTVAGLSAQLGNWFSGIKSGISHIASILGSATADGNDTAGLNSLNEGEAEVHTYEQDQITNINNLVTGDEEHPDAPSLVNQGYLTVPTGEGITGALAAVGLLFGLVFNNVGSYTMVITIPLVLGLAMLVVGHGSVALGRFITRNKIL